MKRLTEKGKLYEEDQIFRYLCDLNIVQCLNRLRQYEDLELTPDEIMEIDNLYAEKCREVAELQKEAEYGKWIPVEERLPENNDYILLNFSNCMVPAIGRYEEDTEGGAFYLGDCDEEDTCISQNLYVDAWRPLPEPYRPKEPE